MSVEDLFIRNDAGDIIEGYLGDDKQANILFLLREPNTGGKRADKFWFKEVLENNENYTGTAQRAATKYKKVLGKWAELLGCDLTECAYINLYPLKGLGKASSEYKKTLDKLQPLNSENEVVSGRLLKEDAFADIAENRLEIMKTINCHYIVTTIDIFDKLSKEGVVKEIPKGFYYGLKREFRKGIINDKTPIYEFYHPSYRLSNQKLESMTVAE